MVARRRSGVANSAASGFRVTVMTVPRAGAVSAGSTLKVPWPSERQVWAGSSARAEREVTATFSATM